MITGKLQGKSASALLMLSALALLAVSGPVRASATDLQQRHRFEIPSERLSAALTVFSTQSHLRVVTSGVNSDEISPGVTGDLSTQDALTAMLSGTGLAFRQLDAGTLVVVPAAMAKLHPSQLQLVSDVSQDALADQPGTPAAPAAAGAPAAGAPGPVVGTQLQEVTVSASSITIAGYEQPTPVTSVGIGQLQMAAQADITDVLRNLPAFTASASPQNSSGSNSISTGVAAQDQVVLRNLGTLRTLVLVDSQRVNYGSLYGGVELSNIPQTLISRVDVVTAGASAVWGSDAISGVVNYILNHNFNGVSINIAASNNQQYAHPKYNADITLGTPFDDGRGHIEGSASFLRAPSVYYQHQLQGLAGQGTWLVENPACQGQTAASTGQPKTVYGWYCPAGQPWVVTSSGDVGYSTATAGGLIYNCLNAAGAVIAGCSLRNITFIGPNATPTPYNPGNITNTSSGNGGTTNIGAGGINPSWFGVVGAPQESTTAFALASFKINEHVNVSVQLNYGYTSFYQDSYFTTQYGNSNPAILYSGNPYIPASIQSQMTTGGIASLQIGTQNTNPLQGQPNISLQSLISTVGGVALFESRRLTRGVLTFDGDFGGSNWSWNAYFQKGESRQIEDALNNAEIPLLKQAEDAVTVGTYTTHYTAAAYPNPLGIQAGTITCLSNLLPLNAAGESKTCAPLNILGSGPGVASNAAINYIQSVTRAGGNQNYADMVEDVYSGTVQGKAPFGTPAGPVAVAVGAVYRSEEGDKKECGVPCEQVLFNVGNFAGFHGGYNVKEVSAELNAPILKDMGVKDLSVDAAWRGIEYSTSGFVNTYKFGIVSQLIDAVRLRASYSRDIRAGNLEEFFQPPATDGSSVVDLRTGQNVAEFTIHLGNANLLPEVGETRTAGLVFTPFQGFVSSIDWWYIHIKEAINDGLSGISIENFCAAGVASYCEDIVHGSYPVGSCIGPTLNSCGNQPIFGIISQAVNSDSEDTSGIDFLADYRMPFMDGALDFNTQDNYTFMLRYTTLGNTCDVLNSLSGDRNRYGGCNVGANPKFKGTTSVTYSEGGWLGTVGLRVIGGSHYMNEWTSGVQVANNDIPAFFYLDMRLSYAFNNGVTVYGAIDNVGDRILPIQQGLAPSVQFGPNVLDQIYDGYGRVWHIGLRAHF